MKNRLVNSCVVGGQTFILPILLSLVPHNDFFMTAEKDSSVLKESFPQHWSSEYYMASYLNKKRWMSLQDEMKSKYRSTAPTDWNYNSSLKCSKICELIIFFPIHHLVSLFRKCCYAAMVPYWPLQYTW